MQVALSIVSVVLAERRIGTSWRRWLLRAVVPLAASAGVAVLGGWLARVSLSEVGILWRAMLASGTAAAMFTCGCLLIGKVWAWRGKVA